MPGEQATRKFYDMIWPHRSAVLRLARILTGDAGEAEDLAQDALLKAFAGIERFDGHNAKAWVMRILRNARIDRLRASGGSIRIASLEEAEAELAAGDGQDVMAWTQPQEILNAFSDQQIIVALGQLPEEIRWTLLLVDVEGLDQKEAAELLDVPVGTIKSRAHRGRAMLRDVLRPLARELRLVRADEETRLS